MFNTGMLTFFVPWPSRHRRFCQRSVPVIFDRRVLCVPWWRDSIVIFTLDFNDECKDNPCPCIYCPYKTNTPRLMIIQSMTRWVWSWVLLFWHCYFKWTTLPLPVLLGLVKEIALYITVCRCGLKAICWSGSFDMTWSWSHDTHSFHCC